MRNNGLSTTPQYFNIIIRHAWKIFLQNERNELLTCSQNNTTSAYKKTGIYPFDPNCEAWSTILETMKPLNQKYKETKKCEKVQNYEIVKKKNKTILTEEEKKTLMKGLPDETHYILAVYFHMRQILGTWRRELLFNPSAQPSPITVPQIISSRMFAFSPTKTLLADFKKSWTKKGKMRKMKRKRQ